MGRDSGRFSDLTATAPRSVSLGGLYRNVGESLYRNAHVLQLAQIFHQARVTE